jgi:chorismate synthase
MTAILEGLPSGIQISIEQMNEDLARRQHTYGAGPRMKIEHDTVDIVSGIMYDGDQPTTIGSPVAMLIQNLDHARWRGKKVRPLTIPRPGHADLTGAIKYGYKDLRPALERASARETAARVAIGSLCRQFLYEFGIQIGGYVCSIGEISVSLDHLPYEERILRARQSSVQCPDPEGSTAIEARIQQAMQDKNTLGGIIEVVALGVPPGLGSYVHWDRRLDARLGAAILGIQAIKGVEIGPAFENTRLPGTRAQDAIHLEHENLVRPTDRSGGLEGGITTGQPLIVRAAMKPIATTLTPQETADLASGKPTTTEYERSDFCPVPRAVVIVESMVAFVIADAFLEKLGGDSISEIKPRFETLRKARLPDLPMDGFEHVFWPDDEK